MNFDEGVNRSEDSLPYQIKKPKIQNNKIEVHSPLVNRQKPDLSILRASQISLTPKKFGLEVISFSKYFVHAKSYLLIDEQLEVFLAREIDKKSKKIGEIELKSRVLCAELVVNSHLLLFGHLNGSLSIYETLPSFDVLKPFKTIAVFRVFPLNFLLYHPKSNYFLISSFETNKIQLFHSPKPMTFELDFYIRRTDLGPFRSAIFLQAPLDKSPNIIVSSSEPKLHIFNPDKRENHEFIRTSEPIVSLMANTLDMIIGCSLKNNMFFWSYEKRELIFHIQADEKMEPLYQLQTLNLNSEGLWMKFMVFERFSSPLKVEVWQQEKMLRSLSLPRNLVSHGKLEVNTKEILQILYLNQNTFSSQKNGNSNGRFIITAGDDFIIRIYDVSDLSLVRSWQASQLPITAICIINSDLGLLLASASYNNVIQIWDLFQGDLPIQSLTSHTLDVNSLLFIESDEKSNTSAYLVSGSADKTIILWICEQGSVFKKVAQTKACETSVISLEYLKTNKKDQFLAVGSRDKIIKIFSFPKLHLIRDLIGHKDSVKTLLSFRRPYSFFELFYNEKFLDNYNTQNIYLNANDLIKSSETPFKHSNSFSNSFLDPETEFFLISGSMDKTIKIWDIFTGACLYTVHGHDGYVNTLIWLNDGDLLGNRMASASQDGSIKIWDMINLVCLDTFLVDFPRFSSGLCYIKEESLLIYTNYKGEIRFQRLIQDIRLEGGKDKQILMRDGNVEIIDCKDKKGKRCFFF